MIYFITGASGVGKTTLLNLLAAKYKARGYLFYHFDTIGVPSLEQMIDEFGSPAGWQEAKTFEWIEKLMKEDKAKEIFLEGQVDHKYIIAACEKHIYTHFKIVLIDCAEEAMTYRLRHERNQPELVNEDMFNWLRYLREQAISMHIPSIDTSNITSEMALSRFEQLFDLKDK